MEELEKFAFRSISPRIRNYVSPLRGASRLGSYEVTKKKIAKISKSLYNSEVETQPILRLERAVLRGKGLEFEGKAEGKKDVLKVKSGLEKSLQKEHKILNEGTQIIKLPKLPYGQHQTYNQEDDSFYGTHFVNTDSRPDSIKELKNITRKFKLGQRIKSKRNHSKTCSGQSSNSEIVIYNMDSGQLFSTIHKDIIDSYENDKSKYLLKHHYVYQTFRDLEFNKSESFQKKITAIKKTLDLEEMLKRLYNPPERKTTDLAKHITLKYPLLFGDSSKTQENLTTTFDLT